MLFFQIIPPSPPTESKSLSFMYVSPLLPCMQDHQYRLSRFHNIQHLSDLFHSVQQALGSFTSLELTHMCSFLQLSNISLFICTTTFLFCVWTLRLLPRPSYYKQCCNEQGYMCLFQFWFPHLCTIKPIFLSFSTLEKRKPILKNSNTCILNIFVY